MVATSRPVWQQRSQDNERTLVMWHDVRQDHPQPGGVVAATRVIVDSFAAFVERTDVVSRYRGASR